MKLLLTFKVVLLFSYQIALLPQRKLLYFITRFFLCQELFSNPLHLYFYSFTFSSFPQENPQKGFVKFFSRFFVQL